MPKKYVFVLLSIGTSFGGEQGGANFCPRLFLKNDFLEGKTIK